MIIHARAGFVAMPHERDARAHIPLLQFSRHVL